MKVKGYLFAVLSAISYGLIPLFVSPIKTANFSMDVTLAYRFVISALFILALLIYKKEPLSIKRSELLVLVTLGVLFALSSEFLFMAYDYLSAGIASTILFVYPLFVAITMAVFFGEKISKPMAVSLIVTLGGIFILSARNGMFDINYTGLLVALTSAVCYALYIILVNKSKVGASGFKLAFYSMLFSGGFYLVKALLLKESLLLPDTKMLLNITVFGFSTSVISITALVYAIKLIGSTTTSIMGALEPVVAVAISVMLFHEAFTFRLATGIVLILCGVIINILAEQKSQQISSQEILEPQNILT
jgi:drug/metabolite transporter (DMT)-like permease